MKLSKGYLIRVVKKRLIEFVLMFSVISLVLFGFLMTSTKSDTGILYNYGDNWYIDPLYLHNNSDLGYYDGISNPESFPHVLVLENNGTEVHYRCVYGPILAYWGPHYFWFYSLDLLPVYGVRQFILHICIVISIVAIFIFLFLNRKMFQFTNKLLS